MKFLLIVAFVALAVAGPTYRTLDNYDITGLAPVVEYEPVGPTVFDEFPPIVVGKAMVDEFEPIVVGPAVIDSFEPITGPPIVNELPPIFVGPNIPDQFQPVVVGTADMDSFDPIVVPVNIGANNTPLLKIFWNVNKDSEVPAVQPATPKTLVEISEPVLVGDEAIESPQPVIVDGSPEPVMVIDTAKEIFDNVESTAADPIVVEEPCELVAPRSIVIGTPVFPEPVAVAEVSMPVLPTFMLPGELSSMLVNR